MAPNLSSSAAQPLLGMPGSNKNDRVENDPQRY